MFQKTNSPPHKISYVPYHSLLGEVIIRHLGNNDREHVVIPLVIIHHPDGGFD